jgi:hypothetical protein
MMWVIVRDHDEGGKGSYLYSVGLERFQGEDERSFAEKIGWLEHSSCDSGVDESSYSRGVEEMRRKLGLAPKRPINQGNRVQD